MPVSRDVAASAGRVWTLLSEVRYWPDWGSSIRAVQASAEVVAPGVTGRVRTVAGLWLPFAITAVDPGRSWDWKVAGMPATGHSVLAAGEARCVVELTAPWFAAPYVLVLRRAADNIKRMAEAS